MEAKSDPFAHHPDLHDKIADPESSFFRDLDPLKLQETIDSHGGPRNWVRTETEREALRRDTLASRPKGDLWVFGYGSLMWDPGIKFSEVRYARLEGYARRMILLDVLGGRGTPESPGLMAGLDGGPGCDGLVFRIPETMIEDETERLWRREMVGPGYIATFADARLSDRTVQALAFVADHGADLVHPDLTRDAQLSAIRLGTGFLGTSLEYIENLDRNLRAFGVTDPYITDLLDAARAAPGTAPASSG